MQEWFNYKRQTKSMSCMDGRRGLDARASATGTVNDMAKKRNGRQDAIREIVRTADVRTQRMLVDELKACGFDCTQATVSRDIADMGLHKLPEGMYVLAEDLHLQRMVSELVIGVQRTENLVIIKAQPGTALGIAAAIDAAELPDVLGSLAGNDTILVITRTAADGEQFELMIGKLRSVRK